MVYEFCELMDNPLAYVKLYGWLTQLVYRNKKKQGSMECFSNRSACYAGYTCFHPSSPSPPTAHCSFDRGELF